MENVIKKREGGFWDKVEWRGMVLEVVCGFFKEGEWKIEMEDKGIGKSVLYMGKDVNEGIELEKVGEMCCVWKEDFMGVLKKELGSRGLEYMKEKKIEKGEVVVMREEVGVKEIGFEVGFEEYC